jgi:hypothetical protein
MRAHEFITEQNHEQDAKSELITLITTNHAMDISPISIQQLVKSLADRNFFVDEDWVFRNAKQIPVVDADATSEEQVVLKNVTSGRPDDGETKSDVKPKTTDDKSKVSQMAKSALDKRI